MYDAVLGGINQFKPNAAVLGGIKGFEKNLANGNLNCDEALAIGEKYKLTRQEIILAFNLGNKEFGQTQENCKKLLSQIQNFEVTELIENGLVIYIDHKITITDLYNFEKDSKLIIFRNLTRIIFQKRTNLRDSGFSKIYIDNHNEIKRLKEDFKKNNKMIDCLDEKRVRLLNTNASDNFTNFYNSFEQLNLKSFKFIYDFPKTTINLGEFMEFLESNLEKFINPKKEYFE